MPNTSRTNQKEKRQNRHVQIKEERNLPTSSQDLGDIIYHRLQKEYKKRYGLRSCCANKLFQLWQQLQKNKVSAKQRKKEDEYEMEEKRRFEEEYGLYDERPKTGDGIKIQKKYMEQTEQEKTEEELMQERDYRNKKRQMAKILNLEPHEVRQAIKRKFKDEMGQSHISTFFERSDLKKKAHKRLKSEKEKQNHLKRLSKLSLSPFCIQCHGRMNRKLEIY